MSYSFGFVLEDDARYDTVQDTLTEKFSEVYPEPADEVKEAVTRLGNELPYLAEEFLGGSNAIPDGHSLNVIVSGHEHVDDNDQAPRYQSITLTLNKKPEEAESDQVIAQRIRHRLRIVRREGVAEIAESADVAEQEPVTA